MRGHRLCLPAAAAVALAVVVVSSRVPAVARQGDDPASPGRTYQQVKAFALTGGSATLSGFVLKRDHAEMTLTGTMYFAAPVDGHVTGGVFIGDGTFHAAVPPSDF